MKQRKDLSGKQSLVQNESKASLRRKLRNGYDDRMKYEW